MSPTPPVEGNTLIYDSLLATKEMASLASLNLTFYLLTFRLSQVSSLLQAPSLSLVNFVFAQSPLMFTSMTLHT